MDRIWRTTLKMPQSPQRSMVRAARSTSRTKSRSRSGSALARAASFKGKARPESEAQSDEFAESIVKSVKVVVSTDCVCPVHPFLFRCACPPCTARLSCPASLLARSHYSTAESLGCGKCQEVKQRGTHQKQVTCILYIQEGLQKCRLLQITSN